MADPRIKQLRIQAGVVKRSAKELDYYRKELEELKQKVQSMKDNNEDEYDIGKKGELVQETQNTLEDSKRRLTLAIENLENLVADCGDEFNDRAEFNTASKNLEFARSVVV